MVPCMKAAKIRLYVDHPLGEGQTVPLNRDQAHYLFNVMRRGSGDRIKVFDGASGEFEAEIAQASKRDGALAVLRKTAGLREPPDLWLLFAPIKKARTDFIVEKAAELGVKRILPVATDFTNSERIRRDRLQAHAIEAAEQCGGTYVPEVSDIQPLAKVLEDWPGDRSLIFCDEAEAGAGHTLHANGSAPSAILIGPEGGFSDAERAILKAHPNHCILSLGPRILRADTAAVAAITTWQSTFGDWT